MFLQVWTATGMVGFKDDEMPFLFKRIRPEAEEFHH